MELGMRSIFALALGLVASQAALAATASVTVASGTVSVAPSPLVLPAGDTTMVFQMRTPGFTITSAGLPGFGCSLSSDGLSATCRRSERAAKGELQVSLGVKPAGGGDLPSPNVWLQAD